jgi:hypothetical protein
MTKCVHLVSYSRVYVYNYTYNPAELLFKLLAPVFGIKAIKKEKNWIELRGIFYITGDVT